MIYFDGAIPESKRVTRLKRLEKHRQTLEAFTKMRMKKVSEKNPTNKPAKGKALLGTWVPSSRTFSKALEPPFMVASAIEHLKGSVYGCLTKLIPDEADVGCLVYAGNHQGVAMLSNDSDLLCSPSGSRMNLTLVLPDTLRLGQLESDRPVLMASCLRPSEICRQIGISSLHMLAYQRLINPTASFSVIKQHAKDTPSLIGALIPDPWPDYDGRPDIEEAFPAPKCSVSLDPRLSEVWSQYLQHSVYATEETLALFMYLPALFEDPTRESPWAHGSNLRQLAYSLLDIVVKFEVRPWCLLEYQRRGFRVTDVKVDLLCQEDFLDVFSEDTSILQHVRVGDSAAGNMAAWQKVALQAVNKRRAEDGRFTFLPPVHLIACIQAVLYSLRLLKQAAEVHISREPTSKLVPQDLLDKLATMPALGDLMDATKKLHESI